MADPPVPARRLHDIERLVAAVLAEKLAQSGASTVSGDALLADQALRNRDFMSLGLNSLDWMDVATTLEDELGIELPDGFLLDTDRRTLAGWSDYLAIAAVAEHPGTTAAE